MFFFPKKPETLTTKDEVIDEIERTLQVIKQTVKGVDDGTFRSSKIKKQCTDNVDRLDKLYLRLRDLLCLEN